MVSSAHIIFALLVNFCIKGEVSDHQEPTVTTIYGNVRGTFQYLETLFRSVDVYVGVPYAKPPIGDLRFKHPQVLENWEETFEATKIPNPCWQLNVTKFGSEFSGIKKWNSNLEPSEDCLYLNVYVPKEQDLNKTKKYAVMVWIHGGGFYSGSSNLDMYDGRYLAAISNTIVVSMNYRLGSLGFFTLNDTQAPPNVGLYDQLMALQWVQENIAAFGGDPNNVTIFGESAGAASVSFHLLSPLSGSKFNRAILQSGSANGPWAAISMEESVSRSKALAKRLQCLDENNEDVPDVDEVMTCLKNKEANLITQEQWVVESLVGTVFLPTVDGHFLPDNPQTLLDRHEFKKCPILLGSNANEGSYILIYSFDDLLTLESTSMSKEEYENSFESLFNFFPQYPSKLSDEQMVNARALYNPPDSNQTTKHDYIHALDMAVADSYFVCPLHSFARSYASANQSVYAYYFTQRILHHEWPDWMGVLHGDEILFLISDVFKRHDNYTPEERTLSREMISYWSNFAKTGDPNEGTDHRPSAAWPEFKVNKEECLEFNISKLSSSSYTVMADLWRNNCNFWDNL